MKTKIAKTKKKSDWRSKPRATISHSNINTQWLEHRLDQKGMNKSALCRAIDMRNDLLSRVLSGERRLQFVESERMALALDLSHDELLVNLGLKKPEILPTPHLRTISVDGWLDGTLTLRKIDETPGLKGPKTAACPLSPERDLRVVRVQAVGSENDGLDGVLVYYRLSAVKGVSAGEDLGRPALVQTNGVVSLRVVRRGYSAGRYNLTSLTGKLIEENVAVDAVHPVLWFKFG